MGDYLMNNKPDNIVSKKIIKEFLEKQLLSEDKKEEWKKKLSMGETSVEEWNLLAEFYIKKEDESYE